MKINKRIKSIKKEQAELLLQENNLKMLSAKDAMIKPVFLYPDDPAELILKKLKKEHVNACIVVTKEKKFLGEISENNIIKLFLEQVKNEPLVKIINRGYRREFLYKTAKDIANKHKTVAKKHTPINTTIKLLWKKNTEYVPVLDNNDRVVGVVTPSSIIKLLKDY